MKTQICWPSVQFTGCHYALLSNSDSSLKRVTNELFFPSLFFDTDMRWGLYSYVLNQGWGRQRWSGEWGLLFMGVTAIHVKKMKAQIHKTKSCKSTDSAQMLHIIRSSTKNILCQFSQHLLLFPDQITDTFVWAVGCCLRQVMDESDWQCKVPLHVWGEMVAVTVMSAWE